MIFINSLINVLICHIEPVYTHTTTNSGNQAARIAEFIWHTTVWHERVHAH